MNACSTCEKQFEKTDLLESSDDSLYMCKQCFRKQYRKGSKQKTPSNNEIQSDGDGEYSSTNYGPMTSEEDFQEFKRKRIDSMQKSTFISKRPIQCPHMNCNRYIRVDDLPVHMIYEHSDVPVFETSLDIRNTLKFSPTHIRYGIKECLMVLHVVVPSNNQANGNQAPTAVENSNSMKENEVKHQSSSPSQKSDVTVHSKNVSVAVLASRISKTDKYDGNNESSCEDVATSDLFPKTDKIVLWLASNVPCSYCGTIAVSNLSEDLILKFYAPPVLLFEKCPKKLWMDGNGLILTHFHVLGASENYGSRLLNLDVVIDSDDD